jgi:proteasome lid subunit RPN8/RPN11
MLRMSAEAHQAMLAHAIRCTPEEACGLLLGAFADEQNATAPEFMPLRNASESALRYSFEPKDLLGAFRAADDAGRDVVGVMHSHTHTEAYPSPTDVAEAAEPAWHYVIVSLRHEEPVLRSFRLIDGTIAEEPVEVDL